MGRGKEVEAVAVMRKVAQINGKEVELSVDVLRSIDDHGDKVEIDQPHEGGVLREKNVYSTSMQVESPSGFGTTFRSRSKVGISSAIHANLAILDFNHVKPLFATRRLAYSTTLLVLLWGTWFYPSATGNLCIDIGF